MAEPEQLPAVARHRAVHRPPRFSFARLREEWPLNVVLLGLLASLLLMIFSRWRRGAFAIGLVALAAAALRALLPGNRIGLLALRSRWFDVVFYGVTGALVVWLSLSVDSLGTG